MPHTQGPDPMVPSETSLSPLASPPVTLTVPWAGSPPPPLRTHHGGELSVMASKTSDQGPPTNHHPGPHPIIQQVTGHSQQTSERHQGTTTSVAAAAPPSGPAYPELLTRGAGLPLPGALLGSLLGKPGTTPG